MTKYKNLKTSYQEIPKRQNDVLKDNIDIRVFPKTEVKDTSNIAQNQTF